MAHNSKRNRRDTTTQDGDDYIYPTAKVRETKTRNRKHDSNLIRAGLEDQENRKFDEFEQEGEDESADPNFSFYEIEELMEEFGTDADPDSLFPDDFFDNDEAGNF